MINHADNFALATLAAFCFAFVGFGCAEGTVNPGPGEDAGPGGDVVEGDADAGPTNDADGGPTDDADGGPTNDADGGPTDDADAGPSIPPTDFKYPNSGGGTTSSSNYRLKISVGAPGSGAASGDDHRLRVAPVSP